MDSGSRQPGRMGSVRGMGATQVRKTYFIVVVADMDRAVRFYAEAFGASVVFSSAEWSEVTVTGTTIALHPGGDGTETATGLGFEVDDLDGALRQVTRAGGRVTSPARDRPAERIRLAQVADSEGNVLTVAEARG
jgi:predicted enzyme related to lactoylglutathione lyase